MCTKVSKVAVCIRTDGALSIDEPEEFSPGVVCRAGTSIEAMTSPHFQRRLNTEEKQKKSPQVSYRMIPRIP
jgi:hypothetical protein